MFSYYQLSKFCPTNMRIKVKFKALDRASATPTQHSFKKPAIYSHLPFSIASLFGANSTEGCGEHDVSPPNCRQASRVVNPLYTHHRVTSL
jgi:hypothetical protein